MATQLATTAIGRTNLKGIVVVGGHWNRCQHQVTGVSKRPGPGNLLSLGTITMASSPEDGPDSRTDDQRALDEAWNNPANWVTVCGHRVLYHSLIDPRIVVQKAPLHVGSVSVLISHVLGGGSCLFIVADMLYSLKPHPMVADRCSDDLALS